MAEVEIPYKYEEVRDVEKSEEALRRQLSRTGDTIYKVRRINILDIGFVPMSVVANLRREVLQKLAESETDSPYLGMDALVNREMSARNRSLYWGVAKYPNKRLTPQDNVTNHLAREFYTACGVEEIAEGLDCRTSTAGEEVVISDYCIRREIGECLKEKPRLKGDLYLVRGTKKYRLCFDCKACQMRLIDVSH
jgi:putative protease